MRISKQFDREYSRWVIVAILLCAVIAIPIGVASAQDFEAVERRLGEAVEKGKLSESDAWEKWRYFKKHELGPKLKALVKEGELSEGAAREFWDHLEGAEKEREHEDESASADKQTWIAEALMEHGKLDRGQIRSTLAVLPRVVHELQKSKADDIDKFKLSEGVQKYFMDEIGLKAEQIKLVVGIAHRLQLAKNDGTHTD